MRGLARPSATPSAASRPRRPGRSPALSKPGGTLTFSEDTYFDPDAEIDPSLARLQTQFLPAHLRLRLGDLDGALRAARAMPKAQQDFGLSSIVGQLAHQGEVARALELAATITRPEARLAAIERAAVAVRDKDRFAR